MYCGCRGCTSQVREPVGQLVPFEKHDCQTHHPTSDVIGFLVKGRCVRSRRLLWRLRRSIFNLPVTGLFVANLLTTAKFRDSSQKFDRPGSSRQKPSLLRQTAYKRSHEFGFASASRKASRRRMDCAQLRRCGPYISARPRLQVRLCKDVYEYLYPCT